MRILVPGLLLLMLAACGGGSDAPTSPTVASAEKASGRVMRVETVRGEIRGLGGVTATVILGNQGQLLLTAQTDSQGKFEFTGVPHGTAFIKAEAAGLVLSPPQSILVGQQTAPIVFSAAAPSNDTFHFYWDNTLGAHESAVAHVNTAPSIKYLDEVLPAPDTAAASRLLALYQVVLSDKGVKWNHEYASRLLTLLGTLPTRPTGIVHQGAPFRISKWELTNDYLDGDIRIQRNEAGDTVLLSTAVFTYATPRLVTLDGVQGRFFSKRLHHALVRFATQDGKDTNAANTILVERHGVSTMIDDYRVLTAKTTREGASSFAPFKPEELVTLINAFEEMPEAFHKVRGLQYLVRRAYGQVHPVDKRIIAQAHPASGYIEFTDQALAAPESTMSQGIILHEKAHFLWSNVFSTEQQEGWINAGGWYRDATGKWRTRQTAAFVSAYAHDHSPEEDVAESVAAYVFNPDLLRSRAQDKFNFLKDRIFKGDRIIAMIREDLTFMVLGNNPDIAAPGLVKRLDIRLQGGPSADKALTATMELASDDGPTPGARECVVTLMPPSGNAARKRVVYFAPWSTDGTGALANTNATVLTARQTFSRHTESGYWQMERATCTDVVGNQRFLGPNELGNASIYFNSQQELLGPPKYEPGSLSIQSTPVIIDGNPYHRVTATWRILPHTMTGVMTWSQLMDIDTGGSRLYAKWSYYDSVTRIATEVYEIPAFFKSGRYGLTTINTADIADNRGEFIFPDLAKNEPAKWVDIHNPNADSGQVPELDLNRITVAATPVRPAAPDGETTVKIAFYARDDVAGFSNVYILLRNPQGEIVWRFFSVSPGSPGGLVEGSSPYGTYFPGDPRAWQRYQATITLPVGSMPGKWGVQSFYMADGAGFGKYYEFLEFVHFTVSRN